MGRLEHMVGDRVGCISSIGGFGVGVMEEAWRVEVDPDPASVDGGDDGHPSRITK